MIRCRLSMKASSGTLVTRLASNLNSNSTQVGVLDQANEISLSSIIIILFKCNHAKTAVA